MSSLCPEAMDYQQPSHNHNDSGDKPRSIGPNSSQVHTRSLLRSTRHMGSQRPTLYPPEPQWTNQSILMSTSTSTQYVKVVRPQPSAYPRGEGLDTVMMVVRRKKGLDVCVINTQLDIETNAPLYQNRPTGTPDDSENPTHPVLTPH